MTDAISQQTLLNVVFASNQPAGAITPSRVQSVEEAIVSGLGNMIETVALLRTYGPASTNDIIYLDGYATPGDGGQGLFQWAAGDTAGDDGGTVIATSANPGPSGPNLVPAGAWTINDGSPVADADGLSDSTVEFWQAQKTITGLTIGVSYTLAVTYTLAGAAGAFIAVAPPTQGSTYNHTAEGSPTVWTFTFTATATSGNLIIAGEFAPATITNISVAQAPGGRWLRQLMRPIVVAPEWFGAAADDSTDDTAAIQAAINYAQTNATVSGVGDYSRGRVALCGGKIYKCLGSLSLVATKAQLWGNGAILDFSAQSTPGTCLTLTTQANPFDGNALCAVENLGITGIDQRSAAGGSGVATQTLVSVQGSQITLRRLYLIGSGYACDLSFNNVYIVTLEDCILRNSIVGYRQVLPPSQNSGENMQILGGCIDGCNIGVDWTNSNGGLWCDKVSFDANGTNIRTQAGPVRAAHTHFEQNGTTLLLSGLANFVCLGTYNGTFAEIVLTEPEFVWTGGNPAMQFIDCTTPLPGGVKIDGPVWSGGAGYEQGQTRLTLVPSSDTFDPSRIDPSLTASNGDLTVTATHSAANLSDSRNVFALSGGDAGKTYFEVNVTAYNTSASVFGMFIGIAQGTALTEFALTGSFGIWWDRSDADSGVWIDGGMQGSAITFSNRTPPFTIGCIVDRTNNVIDWTEDGSSWIKSYSPSAGTGGQSITALENINLFPVVGLYNSGDSATINFGDSAFTFSGIAGSNSIVGANTFFTVGGGGSVTVRRSKSANGAASTTGGSWPPLMDATNTWNFDFGFENGSTTSFMDAWTLTQDSAGITSRTTGTNISITQNTTKPHTGFQALAAAKAGAATTVAAFGLLLRCDPLDSPSLGVWYAASANSLGTVALNIKYVNLLYYGSGGVPFFGEETTPYTVTLTPTTTYQQKLQGVWNNPAPSWATHVLVEVDMNALGAGTLYIDDCEVYRY